jgi:hypothetical protein
MRLIIFRMLSSTSLSAFSASVAPGRVDGPAAIRPIRDLTGSSRASSAAASTAPSAKPGITPQPGQILPRGSLLNLSV